MVVRLKNVDATYDANKRSLDIHVMNVILILSGHLCVLLGVAGIFLPILPTTPFLLLAAFFYSRGSSRFHDWLTSHTTLGPYVNNWQQHKTIPLNAKILATTLLSINLTYPVFFLELELWIKLAAVVTGVCVMIFIWSCPSNPPI